jgi:hypothetical protein
MASTSARNGTVVNSASISGGMACGQPSRWTKEAVPATSSQLADFFRGAGGDGERQLRAERPAAKRGVGLQAGGDVVGGVVKVADQRCGAITRQVENCAI